MRYFIVTTDEQGEHLWVLEGDDDCIESIKYFTEEERKELYEHELLEEGCMRLWCYMNNCDSYYKPEEVVEITKEEYESVINALSDDDDDLVEELKDKIVEKYGIKR